MIMAVIYVSELALYNSLNVSYIVDQCIKKNHSAICRLVKHLLERCSFFFFQKVVVVLSIFVLKDLQVNWNEHEKKQHD